MAVSYGQEYIHNFAISAADLSAGGDLFYFSSPCDGVIAEMELVVKVAIVTGGIIKLRLGAGPTDVVGATVTVADAAAAGTVYNAKTTLPPDSAHTTMKVTKGLPIKVNVAAAFNGGGEIAGWVRIEGGK